MVTVTEDQARSTLKIVRNLYKGGLKSSIKAYTIRYPSLTPSSDPKHNPRNNNIRQSGIDAAANRAKFKGWTPYQIGEYLYKQECQTGNCGEMAVLALYVAMRAYWVPREEAFLWKFTAPGGLFPPALGGFGHQVAFLGDVDDLQNSWVVDPWCNLCSRPGNYADTDLMKKLDKWETQGKRILVPGLLGGWVEPTHRSIAGILAKNALFSSCRADRPIPA